MLPKKYLLSSPSSASRYRFPQGIRQGYTHSKTWLSRFFLGSLLIFSALLLVSLDVSTHFAQAQAQKQEKGQRRALVIGMRSYPNAPLNNTERDARDMSSKLKNLGFQVTTAIDQTNAQLENTMETYLASLQRGDVSLVYYSGHGVQAKIICCPLIFRQPARRIFPTKRIR